MLEPWLGIVGQIDNLVGYGLNGLAQPIPPQVPLGLAGMLGQQLQALPISLTEQIVASVDAEMVEQVEEVDNMMKEVQDLFLELQEIGADLLALNSQLTSDVADTHREIINRIESALFEWGNVAIFIRDDFDDRIEKISGQELHDAVDPSCSAFKQVEAACKACVKIIGNHKSKLTDEYYVSILGLENKVENARISLENASKGIEYQIRTAESSLATMQQSLDQEKASVDNLLRKAHDIDHDLWWDIGHVFHDTSGMYDAVKKSQIEITKTELKVRALKKSQEQLKAQQGIQQHSLLALEQYKKNLDDAKHRNAEILQTFGPLEESSIEISRQVAAMRNKVEVTTKLSWTKEMFACGILEVCILSDIHPKIPIRVALIEREVSFGYAFTLPAAVSELAAKLDETSNDILTHYKHW